VIATKRLKIFAAMVTNCVPQRQSNEPLENKNATLLMKKDIAIDGPTRKISIINGEFPVSKVLQSSPL